MISAIMFLRAIPLLFLAAADLFMAARDTAAQSVQVTAPIAFLYDVGTDGMLFDKKADELHPPASVIKLLTAETVFHTLKEGQITLEQDFPITESVWRKGGAPSGGAAMFAPLNSRVAVSDLLQGLTVQSANDAAMAFAEGIAGNEQAFVARMQERANVIGLTKSQVRNVTGFAHPEQKVTAREMALLTKHIIQTYPERFPLFNQREFTWNKIRQTNRNPLLAMNIGADGMKTGNTNEAGFNLVGTAQQDSRRLIVVVFGADSAINRAADAKKLLEWGFSNFERRKLLDKGVALTEAKVSGGTKSVVPLGLKDDVTMLLPKSAADVVTTSIIYRGPVRAPVAEGAEIGRLQVKRSTTLALDVPIIALEAVPEGSLGKRALDNSLDWITGLFRRNTKI
jgi:serine-type D-Ala-D-Ala carboxypeptidase (penicillin-binding protein 5/6)